MTATTDHLVRALRIAAVAEACSWGGLLVGMLFKYTLTKDEVGVQVMGPIHGVLFVLYCVLALAAAARLHWGPRTLGLALLAAIPPFTTIVFMRWLSPSARKP